MTTKDEVKTLWKLCFNDSDEFTDLYFKMRYKDEVNRVIREDGKIISALQMIPYPMTFCDEVISTSYISGAYANFPVWNIIIILIPVCMDAGVAFSILKKIFWLLWPI